MKPVIPNKFLHTKFIMNIEEPANFLQQKGAEHQQGVTKETTNMSTKSLMASYNVSYWLM